MITANPNSVLSCFVSWTTDKAATSAVQFGQNGYQWEISDTAQVTSHKVLVIGMHAQQTYQIKAISGTASATGTFMTGTLPAQIPNGTVMINDATKVQPGWTLMNVQKGQGDTRARSDYPPYAVMYDSDGKPVWYYVDGTMADIGGAVSTQLTDKGVLIGPSWNTSLTTGALPIEVDFAGNTVWQCPASLCANGKNFTHHASKLSNGDYMLDRVHHDGQPPGSHLPGGEPHQPGRLEPRLREARHPAVRGDRRLVSRQRDHRRPRQERRLRQLPLGRAAQDHLRVDPRPSSGC